MKIKNEEEKNRLFFYLCCEADLWYIKTSNLADFKYVITVAKAILVLKIQSSKFGLKCLFLAIFKCF